MLRLRLDIAPGGNRLNMALADFRQGQPMLRLLDRLRRQPPSAPLYARIVEEARSPDWFRAGAVPDTFDGRFDVTVLVLSLVLARLEEAARGQTIADVTERFIEDMDGSLRQIGIGDQNVGKHVGRMMAALGGRLGAYRAALADQAERVLLTEALARNLYRSEPVDAAALAWTERRVRALARRIAAVPLAELEAGRIA